MFTIKGVLISKDTPETVVLISTTLKEKKKRFLKSQKAKFCSLMR